MKLSGNTVLITGGTSGIGYEFAIQLLKLGNVVLITGRDQSRLEQAKKSLPAIHTFQSDVSDSKEIQFLYNAVVETFPALNVLINNAGIMRKINLLKEEDGLEYITGEIETNLMGTVRMVKQFLPLLESQESAAIVNVSSGLAFVPLPIAPVYCAAKAGVHSFTQSLRVQLKDTRISVFELAPPMTRTPLFARDIHVEDMKGVPMMTASKMVGEAIRGLEKDRLEIHPGMSNVLRLMSRIAPHFILKRLSKSVSEP
ncbi:MAG TPA: SDR family NAD(P)-dependent oxidoreductase [Terriglobales bacterium]